MKKISSHSTGKRKSKSSKHQLVGTMSMQAEVSTENNVPDPVVNSTEDTEFRQSLLQKFDPENYALIEQELANLVTDMKLTPKAPSNTLMCKVCRKVCMCKTIENVTSTEDLIPKKETAQIPRNVLYFGWFFSETTASSLRKFAEDLIRKVINCANCQNVQEFIDMSSGGTGRDPFSVYRKPASSKKCHITAKFCDRKPNEEYEDLAKDYIGKACDMTIVGIFITNSTMGYRVDLDQSQIRLFDNERLSETSKISKNQERQDLAEAFAKITVSDGVRKQENLPSVCKEYPGLVFTHQPFKQIPSCTRAHITLGCNKGIEAKQAGEDLVDVIDLESRTSSSSSVFTKDCIVEDNSNHFMKCTVRQYGRHLGEAFVIHPHHKISARAVFEAVA